jgi:hypothetical protein
VDRASVTAKPSGLSSTSEGDTPEKRILDITPTLGYRSAVGAGGQRVAGLENMWVDFAQRPAADDEPWDLAAHVRH